MGKVIMVHSYKGGTGKTVISANLARHFALKENKKVLLIEQDTGGSSFTNIFQVRYDVSLRYNKKIKLAIETYGLGHLLVYKSLHMLWCVFENNGTIYTSGCSETISYDNLKPKGVFIRPSVSNIKYVESVDCFECLPHHIYKYLRNVRLFYFNPSSDFLSAIASITN